MGSLLRELFSLLLLQVSMWSSDSFSVIGPTEPIVAMLGSDTVLPCRVNPPMSLENMELRWFRAQFSDAVLVYRNRAEQLGEQLVDYKGRTEMVKDYITEGRVAVRIHSLRVSDNGIYKCFFKKDTDFEEAILELRVIGLGSGPFISMVGPEDTGIRLKCTGKGWFPQPDILCKDAKGVKISPLSEVETQDDDGLYQMEVSLIVRDSSNRDVSCSMKNPFFGQEQEETISIPEPFFPRTSPWKIAFVLTFIILGIFVGTAVFLAWKGQQKNKKLQEVKEEKEKECKDKENFQKELERRKELYKHDWKKSKLYADWRKEQFIPVDVTLDQKTAHHNLHVSEDRKQVSIQSQDESEDIFSVLGQNCFSQGRHYWEVEVNLEDEVGPGARWALGVCSDTVKREGWFVESPEKNFWVVSYKDGEFRIPILKEQQGGKSQDSHCLSPRCLPKKIGVFLDWEEGDVSFYNMVDGSHIYSFSRIKFCGTLCPYFSLQGSGTSVTICSEKHPDSSPKTPETHLTNCDTDVLQEANSLLPSQEVKC
ncbi:butyrophilin subfamily 1 member A1-like [Talpa occidentalis]|uniref:butyrophilin subfamily 1 member A1-like n=1 Tax=Talpa occidentalis TaxID=50954 RepID=UPI00189062A1|nr:butyrophilin subfamily 1 member A1-like [Talpa occidentalis]XP_054554681.1 butyrophilin subfamily 1 member A1-like [Talpa occidentalis]